MKQKKIPNKIRFLPLNGLGKYKPKSFWDINEIMKDILKLNIYGNKCIKK